MDSANFADDCLYGIVSEKWVNAGLVDVVASANRAAVETIAKHTPLKRFMTLIMSPLCPDRFRFCSRDR
jgi:hypothetical protein